MNKNRRNFALLFLLLMLWAVFAGGRLPYFIFTVFITILLFSYYSVYGYTRHISSFFWTNKKAFSVGDEIEIGYKLNNTGILPIAYVEIEFKGANQVSSGNIPRELCFIKPFQILNIKKSMICCHRGFYDIGNLVLYVRDLFHIFEKTVDFDHIMMLEIYPRVVGVQSMNFPATEYFGTVAVPHLTYEDYTSLESLQKYVQGDSIKKVHWKLSAKMDQLYVKNYELSGNTRVHIFLDGERNSFSGDTGRMIEEKLVETAASVIAYVLKKDLATALHIQWQERTYIEGRGIEKLPYFLKELMRFQPNGRITIEDFIGTECRMLSEGSTLMMMIVQLTETLVYKLVRLKEKRLKLIVVLISNQLSEDIEKKTIFLKRNRIDVIQIGLQEELPGKLEGSLWTSAK
ncbi:DUF58 domain-containing protein [Geosporobacter ferrireducens]|uniref:DUF58 domain-containing protein n=1 Tax=Geosporobacter ferrireducens TaxID=1424294 RepID=UPI00139D7D6E|nr:DUF58 domain-containing protein [Geosporobacter ferrireducens]MTI56344.1 DUF58 domain-containing protein [Geosporobacter ferrireducens]